MPLSLHNKKIVISAGASGIGWATAKICLSKGAIIGVIGSLIGLFIALLLGWAQEKYHILSISEDIYFMDHLPISFNINNILLILLFGIISSLIASFWPAKIAANIKPADAMKYE